MAALTALPNFNFLALKSISLTKNVIVSKASCTFLNCLAMYLALLVGELAFLK